MKKPLSKTSALKETKNNSSSTNVNPILSKKIKLLRQKEIDVDSLLKKLLSGDKTALSQSITLVESNHPKHRNKADLLIEKCLPFANNSVRIGITGVPGVGKSTFIESFGRRLIQQGKKVAVLAVDPTSSLSNGSILGDKTRMENLVKEENAFIRPSPSGDSLGGVAKKTRETIILCEAAGFDTILIETVGVGQSETTVHSMTDFFLLLKISGAGDELQGIKRGIMEMADAIVINKADGENIKAAKRAKVEFNRALHLYPPKENNWVPKVLLASALEDQGIDDIWQLILKYVDHAFKNGHFEKKRHQQNKFWLLQTINESIKNNFYNKPEVKIELKNQLQAIENNETTAFAAAKLLLSLSEGENTNQ
ncbi:MAG TPA: methylmalonyl Co-A mutase-associated GTPase MeaB [Salinimicrobium sp.]|nr:methylmalonyl Co-A mutase-associated GTPase MeaB [Salinimicrobium sp.]